MRRIEAPFNKRRYIVDTNPLTKVIHDLDNETHACNIHKVLPTQIEMMDTESQVNKYVMLHDGFVFCKACMKEKHDRLVDAVNK